MFSPFFIRSTIFRRAQSTVSVSRIRSVVGLGSATAVIGTLAVGWYGGKYHFNSTKAAESLVTPAAFPDIEPERNYPFQFLKPPTPAEVTEILTQKTWSFTGTGVPGVSRCDGAQLPSNGQIEDRFVYGKVPSPFHERGNAGDDWLAVGVFDGHCGSQTSEAVSKSLVPYVYGSLRQLAQPANDASVDQAIEHGFVALDDVFMQNAQQTMDSNASFAEKVQRLTPGSNGSCALLTLFDPSTRTLRVACTGDSRAVMGYQSPDGKWETVALSVDQNVKNEAEIARVHREHPGEEATLVNGSYYMGLQPTRVFGDGRQKWPLELFNEAAKRYNANWAGSGHPRKLDTYKTPPYHTARPEVTTVRLEKGRRAFLIVATDGLWDTMSSEQAVGLLGRWVDWDKAGRPATKADVPDFGPYDLSELDDAPQFEERKTTVQDDNAAVHLMRNALGGAHHDLISGLLAFKPPFARHVRDDITAQVVFFEG